MTTKKSSQSYPENALSAIISSSARVAVLQALLLDPVPSYYQRQLESATGLPLRAVQRELDRLSKAGLLFRRAEGNRIYYQVNMESALFPELRGLVMKSVPPALRLRGDAAMEPAARLCLLSPARDRALVVHQGRRPALKAPGLALEFMDTETFLAALSSGDGELARWLGKGTDLLGRREDVLWRHIEAAGHTVRKEHGVP